MVRNLYLSFHGILWVEGALSVFVCFRYHCLKDTEEKMK